MVRAEGPLHSAPPHLRRVLFDLAPPLGRTALIVSETAPPPKQTWLDIHWLGRRPSARGPPWIPASDLGEMITEALKSTDRYRPDLPFSPAAQDALLAGAAHFEAAWHYAAIRKARVMALSESLGPGTGPANGTNNKTK